MKLPASFTNLLQKPMDRKEFLKHLGLAGLFVTGAGTIVKSAQDFGLADGGQSQGGAVSSYGSSAYGGSRS